MSWARGCPSALSEKLVATGFRISFMTTSYRPTTRADPLFDQPVDLPGRIVQLAGCVMQDCLQPALDASDASVHVGFGSYRRTLATLRSGERFERADIDARTRVGRCVHDRKRGRQQQDTAHR